MYRTITITLVAALAAVTLACSSAGNHSEIIPGTTAVALPGVPADLRPDIYYVDAVLDTDCDDVASGLRNCQDLLRRAGLRDLLGIVEQSVAAEFRDFVERRIGESADGEYVEDADYIAVVTRSFSGHLAVRVHESPIFRLPDPESYTIRLAVVREEVDYYLWNELIDRADDEDRERVARAFKTMLDARYGGDAPQKEAVRKVETAIAQHYNEMWNKAQASEKRKGRR